MIVPVVVIAGLVTDEPSTSRTVFTSTPLVVVGAAPEVEITVVGAGAGAEEACTPDFGAVVNCSPVVAITGMSEVTLVVATVDSANKLPH